MLKHLILALGHGTRDNQRSTSIVNQHRVHLIDNCEVVFALYHIRGRNRHIVAQVVETILVVGTEGDVGQIGVAASLRVGFVVVDTIHRQAVELIHRTHPLGVTTCKVVVDGHHMHTLACKRIEEHGQSCHQSFTLTCCHLGDFAFVQHHATKQLAVVVYHIPAYGVTRSHPTCVVDSLVAVDIYKILRGSKTAVECIGSNLNGLGLGKTTGSIFHNGKCLG